MQRPASISNEEEWCAACKTVVDTAQAILANELGIIEGARKLYYCQFKVKAEDDEDFLFFVGLDSETDHLPVGEVGKHWNLAALKNKQEEIAKIETFYKERAFEACNNLIAKYRLSDANAA